jgi:hypothetical protein
MRTKITTIAICVLGLVLFPVASRADTYWTQVSQASGAGDWTYPIWTNATVITPVSATNGNSYVCVGNGTLFGNSAGSTTHITTALPGSTNNITFPGDSLTLDQDSELWIENVTNIYFPGTNGNPGLILNGGVLWTAISGVKVNITGSIQVALQSYITLNTGTYAGESTTGGGRYMSIGGQLSGTGNLVLMDCEDESQPPEFPGNLTIAGVSNTFSGEWIVTEGWLTGEGTNSLGTNSIIVDPNYNLQQDPSVGAVGQYTPARASFEVEYPLDSAGSLILTNGGNMILNQNCAFTAVIIEGTSMPAGTYDYTYLLNNFPRNFTNSSSGSLTVRPYSAAPVPPVIVTQPLPDAVFSGVPAYFTVEAVSPIGNLPLTYQWQHAGTNLIDAGNISGSATAGLAISAANSGNAGSFDVIVSNTSGSVTSSVVTLTLVLPSGEPYESAVIAAQPVAFYELNETNDPAAGNAPAYDYAGGYTAIYSTNVQNGNQKYNIAGPRPVNGFPGFTTTNAAAEFFDGINSQITAPAWNLNTNTVTLSAWVMPTGSESTKNAIIFTRAGSTTAGLEYTSYTLNGNPVLGYTWNGDPNTSDWNSGITVPENQWSFVALTITPTNATIYVINTNGMAASTHAYGNANAAFDGDTLIGDDSADADTGSQSFIGEIDDVAIFNQSLSQSSLVNLYAAASGVSVFPPTIEFQPTEQAVYPGDTAQFTVTATGIPVPTYQWQQNGTNLTDGGNISGSLNSTLTITSVNPADTGNYDVVVSNAEGSVTSSIAPLTLVVPNNEGAYERAVDAAGPVAFYELNETNNPAAGNAPAYDFAGQYTGVYGTNVQNGYNNIAGPTPATGWPGFTTTNTAAEFFDLVNSFITCPAWNLNTNTVTLTAWIMPEGNESTKNAIIFCRAGGTIAGLEYTAYTDQYGDPVLGYTWNNDQNTFNWNSGIVVPEYQWSFVALTVTATNATIYLMNANGIASSTHVYNHVTQAFNGVTLIGGDSSHTTSQCFIGAIDDVAVFNKSLSQSNLLSLYTVASGVTNFSPAIEWQPVSESLFTAQTAQFMAVAGSSQPLTYQWMEGITGSGGPYTNLTDGGQISGSQTPVLTITNVTTTNALDYVVLITNILGSVQSSAATLSVSSSLGPETNWVTVTSESSGDWNTSIWSPGNTNATPTEPASTAAEYLGSTFEILPGGLVRTPASASTATFPGNVLTIDGQGALGGSGGPSASLNGILYLKQASIGYLNFADLKMNGGGINVQNSGEAIFTGEMDIDSNTPIFYSGSNQHGTTINSTLTGSATIQYWNYGSGFQPTYSQGLNIAGTANTFNGQWQVMAGVIVGSSLNCLGTNTVTVSTNAGYETTYNVTNPAASLIILSSGRIYLHQNDIFGHVIIYGTNMPPGTYTIAQLNHAYPTNFPGSWTQQSGSSFSATNATATITIPFSGTPGLSESFTGSNFQLVYSNGVLLQATNILGPWVTNPAVSPVTIVRTNPVMFFQVKQ